jgi:hypothetical protein
MTSSRLSFALSQAISGLQLAPLTVCLHMFISYAQIEAFKTKSGLLILRSIFTRAYQVSLPSRLPLSFIAGRSWLTVTCTHSWHRRCARRRHSTERRWPS